MSIKLQQLVLEHPRGSELTREEILDLLPETEYGPGRTKQAFKDDADINKMLAKAQQLGTISHLEKHGAFYGDFADLPTDPFEAREVLDQGRRVFNELPSEIRKDFGHDPLQFFEFVNDPANAGQLDKVLPAIAEPGRYFVDVSPKTPPGALQGAPADDRPAPQDAPPAPPPAPPGDTGDGT